MGSENVIGCDIYMDIVIHLFKWLQREEGGTTCAPRAYLFFGKNSYEFFNDPIISDTRIKRIFMSKC